MPTTLELVKGTSRDFAIQLELDGAIPPAGTFLSSDTLTCKVWPGADLPAIVTPTAAWPGGDASASQAIVSFQDSDSAALDVADYPIQLYVTRGSRTIGMLEAGSLLKVLPNPGTGTAKAIYCTYQDMTDECSWIGEFMDTQRDRAGFLNQRGKAREWMDGLIVKAYPGARIAYLQDGWPSTYGQRSLLANTWLLGILADGGVMLGGPNGRQLVTACACYSIALVLRSQIGAAARVDLPKFAGYFARRANAEACKVIVELDVNGDGVADIAIPLVVTNTRRG